MGSWKISRIGTFLLVAFTYTVYSQYEFIWEAGSKSFLTCFRKYRKIYLYPNVYRSSFKFELYLVIPRPKLPPSQANLTNSELS